MLAVKYEKKKFIAFCEIDIPNLQPVIASSYTEQANSQNNTSKTKKPHTAAIQCVNCNTHAIVL